MLLNGKIFSFFTQRNLYSKKRYTMSTKKKYVMFKSGMPVHGNDFIDRKEYLKLIPF